MVHIMRLPLYTYTTEWVVSGVGLHPYWDSVYKGQSLEVRVQMLLDTSGKSLDSEYKCVHVDHSQAFPES